MTETGETLQTEDTQPEVLSKHFRPPAQRNVSQTLCLAARQPSGRASSRSKSNHSTAEYLYVSIYIAHRWRTPFPYALDALVPCEQ